MTPLATVRFEDRFCASQKGGVVEITQPMCSNKKLAVSPVSLNSKFETGQLCFLDKIAIA